MKEGCISVGTTFTSGEGHIPRGAIYLLDWLPKGYGPSLEDRRICVIFDDKFGDDDREDGLPKLVLAVKATVEKHLRENPDDLFGPIIYLNR